MLRSRTNWLIRGAVLIGGVTALVGFLARQQRAEGQQDGPTPARPPAVTVDPQDSGTARNPGAATHKDQPNAATRDAGDMGAIEHGRYLVHDVAMCVICHSPHLASGEVDTRRLLHGGRIPLESPFPQQEWAFVAPHLAGLPGGWTEERLIELLTTGHRPEGPSPQPPMPPFRMTREDAAAVAAYLKSLD